MKLNTNKMPGLEYLRAVQRGDLDHPPIARIIPMRFEEIEVDRVMFLCKAGHEHQNPGGATHGGFAATVLDSVTGCAVATRLPAGVQYGTIELNVKMMRPVPVDVWLRAEGRVLNISRSLGVSEGSLTDEAGKLYAHATCTCLIKSPDSVSS